MNYPNFFVIGAAKCGTTTVCELLADHPEVFLSNPKEPHYYSRLSRYRELRSWYLSLFEDSVGYPAIGEGSTSYTHPHRIDFVVPRIRQDVPDARLIYMVRHPIRRLESDWKMRLREGRISEPIVEAVDLNASLVTFGLYWKHLNRYRLEFDDEQILVVFLEDLAEDPRKVMSEVYDHVGVDPGYVPDDPGKQRNAATEYREYGVLASALRHLPGFAKVKECLPEAAAEPIKTMLSSQFEPVAKWNPDALDLVRSFYIEDARKLLQYCGKPDDFWSFGAKE